MISVKLWIRRLAHIAALITLMFVMLCPRTCVDDHIPPEIQTKDVIAHFIAFFSVGALGIFAWGKPEKRKNSIITAIVFGILLGLILEGLQELPCISRSCQLKDIFDNTIGIVVGTLVVPLSFWPDTKKAAKSDTNLPN